MHCTATLADQNVELYYIDIQQAMQHNWSPFTLPWYDHSTFNLKLYSTEHATEGQLYPFNQ